MRVESKGLYLFFSSHFNSMPIDCSVGFGPKIFSHGYDHVCNFVTWKLQNGGEENRSGAGSRCTCRSIFLEFKVRISGGGVKSFLRKKAKCGNGQHLSLKSGL